MGMLIRGRQTDTPLLPLADASGRREANLARPPSTALESADRSHVDACFVLGCERHGRLTSYERPSSGAGASWAAEETPPPHTEAKAELMPGFRGVA
jgi:hypothetical protein